MASGGWLRQTRSFRKSSQGKGNTPIIIPRSLAHGVRESGQTYGDEMLDLRQYRSSSAGLPDLLNYAALIDSGVIQCKDGSLLAAFSFRGEDASASSAADKNYITSHVARNLNRFDANWAIWIDAARVPSPEYPEAVRSHFKSPVAALIDAERRAAFQAESQHYELLYTIVVQYTPPQQRDLKLTSWIYGEDERTLVAPADRALAEFERRLTDFEDGLGSLLHMRRLGEATAVAQDGDEYLTDELVNYLHYCLTGQQAKLRIPDCPMYLDAWLGVPEMWVSETPLVGQNYVAIVAIDGFPGHTQPAILSILDEMAMSYRWSTRFIFMEEHEAVGALKRYKLKWQQKVRGFWAQVFKSQKGTINTDALDMQKEAEIAMSEAQSGVVRYGYMTPVVVLQNTDLNKINEQARMIKREIERKGFAARIETLNTIEAWLGALPGHTYPNIRRPLVHTLNLADLLPLNGVWSGATSCPCPFYPPQSPPLLQGVTTGATPFRLNLHVGDVGHTLVFGPTGAGKSTLLATLIAQAQRYAGEGADGVFRPARITAFDKGRSLYPITKATGGAHFDIGADQSEITLAPLSELDSEQDRLWAAEWLATCYELQTGNAPSPSQQAALHRAVKLLSEAPKSARSMTEFCTTVQDRDIRNALDAYTMQGALGHLLDGQHDALKDASLTTFETDELMRLGDKFALPVLLYLFRFFERNLNDQGEPAFLVLDEAWVMLGHPTFRDRIRMWLKELRKKNCAVIMATQSLSDAARSGIFDTLVEQCPTKLLLPNPEADLRGTQEHPGPADLYRMFGLNDEEIALLKGAEKKRQYYYRSPMGRRMFELGLGPLALAFVGISDTDALRAMKRCEANAGENWPLAWLNEKDVSYEQYLA